MSPEFLLTSLLIIASPGKRALSQMASGLARGLRASLVAAVASTLGIIPHMLAAITGLAALLHTSALLFEVLKYLGVLYLLYMAWQTLRDAGPLRISQDDQHPTVTQVIRAGVAMNLLNPKLSIFFLAFLPQFVGTDTTDPLRQMVWLSLMFMVMTFMVFAIYGLLAAILRERILSRPAVMILLRRAFAAGFAALGVKLMLTRL